MIIAKAIGTASARSLLKTISPLLALGGLVSAAVYGERPNHTNAMPPLNIEKEVLQVIEDFNGAFARNDVEKYFSYIDPEVTVITPSNPYRVEGIHDDREEFENSLHTGVSYFQEMHKTSGACDRAWVRGHATIRDFLRHLEMLLSSTK
jgi:hypothetical protein